MFKLFKKRILVFLAGTFICTSAFAEGKNLGLGLLVGQPTGITAMYSLNIHRAIDLTVSYDFSRNFDSFLFMGDYLFRKPESLRIDTVDFGWYWGIGLFYAHFSFDVLFLNVDSFAMGPRFPVGLFYSFPTVPIEVFIEFGLGISVLPGIRFNPTGGIGGRFFF